MLYLNISRNTSGNFLYSMKHIILSIVAFIVLTTLFINLYHPRFQRGDLNSSISPHGIHSIANKENVPLKEAVIAKTLAEITPAPKEDLPPQPLPSVPDIPTDLKHDEPKTNLATVPEVVKFHVANEEVVQYDDSQYLAYLQKSKAAFQSHLGHSLNNKEGLSLDDYMLEISRQPECATRPVFMSMARVSSDLYWQLIENFFYSMHYFDNLVRHVHSHYKHELITYVCCIVCKNRSMMIS